MKRLLGIVSVLCLFSTGAFAQDTLCFMEWRGHVIDLSSSICGSNTDNKIPTKNNRLSVSHIRVSDVQIEQTIDGTSLEVKGSLTNESNKIGSLSLVNFNLINQRTGRILASGAAVVESGDGIEAGEQIAFSKLISKNALGEIPMISDLRVEITSFG